MRNDKEASFRLRREGKSYKEIKISLGVPLGTLSAWFKEEGWSQEVKKGLAQKSLSIFELNKARKKKLGDLYDQARKEAFTDYKKFKNSPIFIAGLVGYWGEGDKVSLHRCRVANSDPGIIRLYVAFLRSVCGVPSGKITASLLIYPDLEPESCLEYWSSETGIPKTSFRKTMVVKGRHPTKRLTYGVCYVVVSSRYLKEKMLIWLRLLGKEFPKADMV